MLLFDPHVFQHAHVARSLSHKFRLSLIIGLLQLAFSLSLGEGFITISQNLRLTLVEYMARV